MWLLRFVLFLVATFVLDVLAAIIGITVAGDAGWKIGYNLSSYACFGFVAVIFAFGGLDGIRSAWTGD